MIVLEEGILTQETWVCQPSSLLKAMMPKVEELSAELSRVHLWDGFQFLID